MSLGASICKMGMISQSDLTGLMEGINEVMPVTCLIENKAQKIKTLHSNYHCCSWKVLDVWHTEFRHCICEVHCALGDTRYTVWSLISGCLPKSEGKKFLAQDETGDLDFIWKSWGPGLERVQNVQKGRETRQHITISQVTVERPKETFWKKLPNFYCNSLDRQKAEGEHLGWEVGSVSMASSD